MLELELAHLREMQNLHRAHTDAHDASFAVLVDPLDRVDAILEKLAVAQSVTEQKLQSLIDVLLRERPNGHN